MKLRSAFLVCVFSFCSVLSWGQQEWNLSPTMSAKLISVDGDWLAIWTTADSEAMPNFSKKKPAPWNSPHTKFNLRFAGKITSIGNYAFAGCENLIGMEYQNSNITTIGDGAFQGCLNLGIDDSKFYLPFWLKSIGNNAFRGCVSIKYLHFPDSLSSIGDGAFQGCTNLNTIWVKWKTPLALPDNVFASVKTADICLYVPKEAKSLYENAKVWKDFNIQEDPERTYEKDHPVETFFTGINSFVDRKIGEKTIVWLILILSIILFIMRAAKEKDKARKGSAYLISNTLFVTVCLLEILYYLTHFNSADDPTWFCSPDTVGWFWTIINFLLFAGIVFNQYLYFFDVMDDAFANGNTECDLKLGLYSYVGGFIAALLCSFFYKAGLNFVFLAVGVMQIIQSILIFRSFGKNIKGAFWAVFIYLLGSIGTVVTILILLGLLIMVAIVVGIVWGALAGSSSKNSSSSSSSSSNPTEETLPYAYCRDCKYYPGAGYNCNHKRGSETPWVNDSTKACRNWERT